MESENQFVPELAERRELKKYKKKYLNAKGIIVMLTVIIVVLFSFMLGILAGK